MFGGKKSKSIRTVRRCKEGFIVKLFGKEVIVRDAKTPTEALNTVLKNYKFY